MFLIRALGRFQLLSSALALGASAEAWAARPEIDKPTPESVRIGLFLPTEGERAAEGRALQRGAERALERANAQGGFGGWPFQLVLGSASASWEASSRELVRLIYDERVWVVVGAVGGRSAHLAEQVVTRAKGEVVFLTPSATDPSLTQINIPWFFRLVPDDRQQAAALAKEIFQFRRLKRVALMVEEGYDFVTAALAFLKAAPPGSSMVFPVSSGQESPGGLIAKLGQSKAEGLVIFTRPSTAAELARILQSQRMSLPLFGPLGLGGSEFVEGAASAAEGAVIVVPGPLGEASEEALRRHREGARRPPPSPWESYAYDAVVTAVEAIRRAGLNRSAIRNALASTRWVGTTGLIRFGPDGNRLSPAELGRVERGRLVALACDEVR